MIIGYDFFGLNLSGNVYDTAISTSHIDEVTIGAGLYDEIYLTVDTSVKGNNERPHKWQLKTIMNAKFKNDLEAGTLDADGHVVTKIQIYRRKYMLEKEWLLVGEIDYDPAYNVYSFMDRFAESGAVYEYATVPVADRIVGDITVSEPTKVDYEGVFISDTNNNFKIEIDVDKGTTEHATNISTLQPLNAPYPIVVSGNQRNKMGTIQFLPITQHQVDTKGTKISAKDEYDYRSKVIDFLQKRNAKVIRNSNGEIIVASTTNIKSINRNGYLDDLADVAFDFIEVGELNNETMLKVGLVGSPSKSTYSFDEDGEIDWSLDIRKEREENGFRPRNT